VTLHNDHVLKWYRWQIWLAGADLRLFHQTLLIQWYNWELAKCSQSSGQEWSPGPIQPWDSLSPLESSMQ
jgi:hypothetical protein